MNTGTDLKVNVHIEPIDGITMDDMLFSCLFFTSSNIKTVNVSKKSMKRVDENNYIAVVCSDRTGPGKLKARLTAFIPDEDVAEHNGMRKEVVELDTGIVINK